MDDIPPDSFELDSTNSDEDPLSFVNFIDCDVEIIEKRQSDSPAIGFDTTPVPVTPVPLVTDVKVRGAVLKCLVCTSTINFDVSNPTNVYNFQASLELDSKMLLYELSKILKISPTVYQGIDVDVVPTPMYCSTCNSAISQCLTILSEIESLQSKFDSLAKTVKDNFITSYQSEPHGVDSAKQFQELDHRSIVAAKMRIRKTFVQCWTSCQVRVNHAAAAVKNVEKTPKNERKRKFAMLKSIKDENEENDDNFDIKVTSVRSLRDRPSSTYKENDSDVSDAGSVYVPEEPEPYSPLSFQDQDQTEELENDFLDPSDVKVQLNTDLSTKPTKKLRSSRSSDLPTLPSKSRSTLKSTALNSVKLESKRRVRSRSHATKVNHTLRIKKSRQESRNFRLHCDICGKGYQTKYYLDAHKVCHEEIKIGKEKAHEKKNKSPMSLLPAKLKRRLKKRRSETTIQKKYKFIMMERRQCKGKHFPFKCKTCGKGYQLKHYLDIHEKCHRGEMNVPCPDCDEKFASVHYMRLHQYMAHTSTGSDRPVYDSEGYLISFRCNDCNIEYNLKDYLIDDETPNTSTGPGTDTSHPTKMVRIECDQPDCSRTFTSFPLFHYHHLRSCSSRPKQPSRDRYHVLRTSIMARRTKACKQGRTEFPFNCQTCGKGYLIEYFLKEHEKVHRGELNFPCTQCEDKFPCAKDLHLHEVMLHQKAKMVSFDEVGQLLFFSCSRCGKEYSRDSYITASGEVSVKCEIAECGKIYPTLKGFQQHHQYHHDSTTRKKKPQDLICNFCGKHFRTSSGLKDHEIKAHTENWKYFCEVCGKGCSSLGKLNQHMLNHTGEKKYQCGQCDKSFKKKLQLTDHINKHNNYFPYVCDECGKSFVGANGLRSHKYYTHQKKEQKRSQKGKRPK